MPRRRQRAIARQVESERERRAKIIAAEGEYQASQRLRQAAERLETPNHPAAKALTLAEISSERSSTLIVPVRWTFSARICRSRVALATTTPSSHNSGLRRRCTVPERRRGRAPL